MYYFYKQDGTIVERDFEYNSEVLDGILSPVEANSKILILEHLATNKFDYNVRTLKISNPKDALDFISKSKLESPNFYKAVLDSMLVEYLKTSNKFNYISGEPACKKIIGPKIIPPKKTEISIPEQIESVSEFPEFKLRRDTEQSSYVYKSPNQL